MGTIDTPLARYVQDHLAEDISHAHNWPKGTSRIRRLQELESLQIEFEKVFVEPEAEQQGQLPAEPLPTEDSGV